MKGFGAAYGFLVSLLIGAGLGSYVDSKTGSTPWGVAVGSVLGFAAGLYGLQKALSDPDERS